MHIPFNEPFQQAWATVVTPYTARPDLVHASVINQTQEGVNVKIVREVGAGASDTTVGWITVGK